MVLRGDLDSPLFEALEGVAFPWVCLDPVHRARSQFVRGAVGFEPMVHTRHDAMAHGHQRPFLPFASRSATKPRRQIGCLGRGGRPHGLAETPPDQTWPVRGVPDSRLPALSWFPGHVPAQLARCWAEGHWSICTQMSAMRLAAATTSIPGMVVQRAIAAS